MANILIKVGAVTSKGVSESEATAVDHFISSAVAKTFCSTVNIGESFAQWAQEDSAPPSEHSCLRTSF